MVTFSCFWHLFKVIKITKNRRVVMLSSGGSCMSAWAVLI